MAVKVSHQRLGSDVSFWLLQTGCRLHRKPSSSNLARQQITAPHTVATFSSGIQGYTKALGHAIKLGNIHIEQLPLVAWLTPLANAANAQTVVPALVLQASQEHAMVVKPHDAPPVQPTIAEVPKRYLDLITRLVSLIEVATDLDNEVAVRLERSSQFQWCLSQLLKPERLWQQVLLASLVIQLIPLNTLAAGMQTMGQFDQGRRTVLDNLLSPIHKTVTEAARER